MLQKSDSEALSDNLVAIEIENESNILPTKTESISPKDYAKCGQVLVIAILYFVLRRILNPYTVMFRDTFPMNTSSTIIEVQSMSKILGFLNSQISASLVLVGDFAPFSAAVSSVVSSIVNQKQEKSLSSTVVNEIARSGSMMKIEADKTGRNSIPIPIFERKCTIPGVYSVNVSVTGPHGSMSRLESAVIIWKYNDERFTWYDFAGLSVCALLILFQILKLNWDWSIRNTWSRFHHLTKMLLIQSAPMIIIFACGRLASIFMNVITCVIYSLVCLTATFGVRYTIIALIYDVRQIEFRKIGAKTVTLLGIFAAFDAYSIFMKNLVLCTTLNTPTYESALGVARWTEIAFLVICIWFIMQTRNCVDIGEHERYKLYSLYVIVVNSITVVMKWIAAQENSRLCDVEDTIITVTHSLYTLLMLVMHTPDEDSGRDEIGNGENGKSIFEEN